MLTDSKNNLEDSLRHPERYPLVIKRNPLDYIG